MVSYGMEYSSGQLRSAALVVSPSPRISTRLLCVPLLSLVVLKVMFAVGYFETWLISMLLNCSTSLEMGNTQPAEDAGGFFSHPKSILKNFWKSKLKHLNYIIDLMHTGVAIHFLCVHLFLEICL